ncbi:MAG: hypothetical protein WCY62_04225 [Clostridia bacterium]|jgi:hypothetical protein
MSNLKIALINGSPKGKSSVSGFILDELKSYFDQQIITEFPFHASHSITTAELEALAVQDILVFAFPLYVDGIPSHLLRSLVKIENYFNGDPPELKVYAVVNAGFFEGKQTKNALDMMRRWSEASGVKWGQGIGIGGGGMLTSLRNVQNGKGPRKDPSLVLRALAKNATEGKSTGNIFVSPNFPRFLYKIAAELGWRLRIRQNGLHQKDLFTQK